MKKEKSELEKELEYKPIYLPVRFFKKEAYIHIDDYKEAINKRENAVNGLEEENKKLKSDLDFERTMLDNVKAEYKSLQNVIKNMNIKVASLEGEIKGLNYTIDKLHNELSECECSFGFESDEVGFWKREYKRLKKWIKDHCKGYGNLFPEDEMKRQWKKADKKRK